jgi:hypothetical protein
MLRRMSLIGRFLIRSLVALALAAAPIPLSATTAMSMPGELAAQDCVGDYRDCGKGDARCPMSETCLLKCATGPALEAKRAPSRLFVLTAASIEELDDAQLVSLLTPPPHPPPRA